MTNVFIIHGTYGNPEENWLPWLKNEVKKIGHNAFVPKFPTPEGQNLKSWVKVFDNYLKYLDKDSVVVGHSTGATFLLSILERHAAGAAFFVSGFTGKFEEKHADPRLDEINEAFNKTFTEREFDWHAIRKNCSKFFVYHSDNDPYVPIGKAEELAVSLDTHVIVIKGAGHFNADAGYIKFERLFEDIKSVLNK